MIAFLLAVAAALAVALAVGSTGRRGQPTLPQLPTVLPWLAARRDRQAVDDELPAVLDLLCLAIGAGSTVSDAIRCVVTHGPAASATRIAPLLAELDSGLPLDQVLRRIPVVVGPVYQPVVAMLQTTIAHGSPVADLILRLSDEARSSRRRQLERRARQTPVLLLFPLVGCSLPALIVGAVVPLILVSV
ncbi:MAG: type II secretion system F family protein [Acidimicrobiales bacterium]